MQQTVIIYSDFMSLPTFYLAVGDYSHLDGTIIGVEEQDESKQEETLTLLYGEFDELMERQLPACSLERAIELIKEGAYVARIGEAS